MKIYNTMTGCKEEFVPLEEGKVRIYVCGPTVYNFFHIGNARPFVVFDTLRRYFKYRGYDVKFVQNFTDVDDKIIRRAKEEEITAPEVSEKYIKEYFEDAKALNVIPADVHPKVSEHIPEIIAFIRTLIDKGYAYEADGDVYYSTRKFKDYGKLSGQNIDDLESGARIAIGEVKKDPLDFALWKAQKEPDEIAWDSPWGKGRPGWHIECSTMAKKHLGETIDIHGGGQDSARVTRALSGGIQPGQRRLHQFVSQNSHGRRRPRFHARQNSAGMGKPTNSPVEFPNGMPHALHRKIRQALG